MPFATQSPARSARRHFRTLIVFHGAHGYISPNWYATPAGVTAVPTWNFAVVHASGRARRLDHDAQFATNLSKLVAKNETK